MAATSGGSWEAGAPMLVVYRIALNLTRIGLVLAKHGAESVVVLCELADVACGVLVQRAGGNRV